MSNTIISFLKNETDIGVVKKEFYADNQIETYLNALLPKNHDVLCEDWEPYMFKGILQKSDFSIAATINNCGGFDTIRGKRNIYDMFYEILRNGNVISFENNNPFRDARLFLINNVPQFIGGLDAERVIDGIYYLTSNEVAQKDFKKVFKQKLNEAFTYSDKKPVWIQSPEWPVRAGKPLHFLKQEKSNGGMIYLFSDNQSGETVSVEQLR